MRILHLAVVGDPHGSWDRSDHELLAKLAPDALLVVGDLSDGQPRIPSLLRRLPMPVACILGNHDTGKDASGRTLRQQIDTLAELHCGWELREMRPPGLAVVGARPASAGGGFHLSQAMLAAYGPLSLYDSAERIAAAALAADPALPLVLLAHSGPAGLGSEAADPCGRDWKKQACDWGDQDLTLAIERIRRQRPVPLVVFGHMHHALKRGQGHRRTLVTDRQGTIYLNAASVPRHGRDAAGQELRHFSWVELADDGTVLHASHRWYGLDGRLLYQELLINRSPMPIGAIARKLSGGELSSGTQSSLLSC